MPEKLTAKSTVLLIVALVVGLSLTPLVASLARMPTYTTSNTLNSEFTDATVGVPDYWDNGVKNQATDNWYSTYVTVESIDNTAAANHIDNGVYVQSVTFEDYDEVTSASVRFSYRVIDNDNAQSIEIRVRLWNGSENVTIFYDNVTKGESASWTTIENDVSDYIIGDGTYTLYVGAEMNGKGITGGALLVGNKPNLFVGFDGAGFTVTTMSMESNLLMDIIPLMYVIALVLGVVWYVSSKKR